MPLLRCVYNIPGEAEAVLHAPLWVINQVRIFLQNIWNTAIPKQLGLVSPWRGFIPPTNSCCPDHQCTIVTLCIFHHKPDIMTPTCNWSIRRTPGGPAIDPTGLGSILGQVTQTRYSKCAYLPNNDRHTIHAAYGTLHIGLQHGMLGFFREIVWWV